MENLISEDMKTKTMIKREKRIERIKEDIKKSEKQLAEQEAILKEEQTRAIERSVNNLNKTLSVDDGNLTLDEIVKFIDFINNDKELTLDETKELLNKMKPNSKDSKHNNQHNYH